MSWLLRPMTVADLPLLPGGDSEFDDWDERGTTWRTQPSGSDPHENGGLTIVDSSTDEVLGNVSWHWVQWGPNAESRNPMIGIWLARTARGRGVGSWAQREVARWLFEQLPINRVEAHTDVENIGEQKALERAGFTREGIVRGAQWRAGAFHDGYLYSLLRADLEA